MIDISRPDLPERPLTLASAEPDRGDDQVEHASGLPPLQGRISLGGPVALPVTIDLVARDPQARAYFELESTQASFHLVHISVTFEDGAPPPPLEWVTVELALSSTSSQVQPVAWSMMPHRVTDTHELQRSFTLGPQLKFLGVEASAGEISVASKEHRTKVFLEALRDLQSTPKWRFTRTSNMPLRGAHRLVMVIRAERGAATGVRISVRAATKGNLLRRYATELPNPLRLESVL
jgi:hypothetical protein